MSVFITFFILADFIVLVCIVATCQRLFKRIYGYGYGNINALYKYNVAGQQWNPYLICQSSDFEILFFLAVGLYCTFICCVPSVRIIIIILLNAKESNIGSKTNIIAVRAAIVIKTSTIRTE